MLNPKFASSLAPAPDIGDFVNVEGQVVTLGVPYEDHKQRLVLGWMKTISHDDALPLPVWMTIATFEEGGLIFTAPCRREEAEYFITDLLSVVSLKNPYYVVHPTRWFGWRWYFYFRRRRMRKNHRQAVTTFEHAMERASLVKMETYNKGELLNGLRAKFANMDRTYNLADHYID